MRLRTRVPTARRPTARILIVLAAAALIAGCGSTSAPKPDPSGDAAFITRLKALCAKAPALKPLGESLGAATNAADGQANVDSVLGVQKGVLGLTRSLSMASPLAGAITDMEAMLLDASMRYQTVVSAAQSNHPRQLEWALGVSHDRMVRARGDLTKLGISGCLR